MSGRNGNHGVGFTCRNSTDPMTVADMMNGPVTNNRL